MPDNSNIGKRDKALLEVHYASGMRISELCNLNLSDISKDEIRVTGKGDKERVVLLGNQAINALVSYLQVRPMTKQRALFVSIRGQRLGIRAIQKMVSNYAKMAGIQKRIHPHTLRHSFATHMLNGGADLRVVQELLGHADLSTTQIYTHLTSSKVRDRYLDCHPGSKE
jgi:integrase/recombinase XerC